MSADQVIEDVIRLVDADNEDEAEQKFMKYFDDMTEEYSVYCWASVDTVSAVIS